MTEELSLQRVEVRFVGAPPAQQIQRAAGVSEVEIDGATLRCLVCGSFQPFLEALRGHEVITLRSTTHEQPAAQFKAVQQQLGGANSRTSNVIASDSNLEGGHKW